MTDPPAAADIAELRSRLLAFYDEGARDLPWRRTRDPYAIWVSEVMCQQTRVDTVIPYWERWMERFATVVALAEADRADVLKSWEGLGYYSRARNLHRGAREVRERYSGRLPDTAEGLREIPGIGPYTSGAIASIAFGEAVPAVDGNVRRVFARLFDEPSPTPARLESWGRDLVDPERPGDFNQALMELGATVCTPRSPACGACPVAGVCMARAVGTVAERPAPKKRARVREAAFVAGVEMDGSGRLRMVRRGPGLLEGMWAFPEVEIDRGAVERLTTDDRYLGAVDHLFSHLRARYHVIRGPVAEWGAERSWAEERRVPPGEVSGLALPVAQQRIFEIVRRAGSPHAD